MAGNITDAQMKKTISTLIKARTYAVNEIALKVSGDKQRQLDKEKLQLNKDTQDIMMKVALIGHRWSKLGLSVRGA